MNTYIIFERPLQEDLENYKKNIIFRGSLMIPKKYFIKINLLHYGFELIRKTNVLSSIERFLNGLVDRLVQRSATFIY